MRSPVEKLFGVFETSIPPGLELRFDISMAEAEELLTSIQSMDPLNVCAVSTAVSFPIYTAVLLVAIPLQAAVLASCTPFVYIYKFAPSHTQPTVHHTEALNVVALVTF